MDLVTVLQNAQSPDPAIRNEAEVHLNQAIEAQYGPFLHALTAELATEGKADNNRQLAGIYIKNLITAKDTQLLQIKVQKWIECDPVLKDQIRGGFLQALVSPSKAVSHTAAQILGAYGAVDVPRKEWPMLLQALLHNVTSPEVPPLTKVSSLEALGYMCETVDPSGVDAEIASKILSTVIDGMQAERPNEVRLAATSALINSIDFAEENFNRETERNVIMQTICAATQCPEKQVRERAYECAARVVELYYPLLRPYVDTLFQLTTAAIKTDDPTVGMMAVEFWSTVCDREIEALADVADGVENAVHLQLIEQAAPLLVPIMLETLMKQPDDSDGDEDDWSISSAAATCLDAMSHCIENNIIAFVLPFVQTNITSTNWRQKEAAVMAFASILEGPSADTLTPIVAQAVPVLIACLGDQAPIVRDTTAWTIGKICEFHKNALGAEVLPNLVTGLSNALSDSSAKVAAQACFAVHNLAQACSEEKDFPTNVISHFMPHMLEKLLGVASREDCEEENMRVSAYEATNMMVANSAEDMRPVVRQLLAEGLNRLEATFANTDAHERANLQSLLCSLVGACVHKLVAEDVTPVADRVMQLLLQVFSTNGAIAHEDAFLAIEFVAEKLENNFARYMPYLSPIIMMGLKNTGEYQVCTACVGLVGSICRALGNGVVSSCDDIMRCLLELLQSTSVDRSVKPHVISVFADIAMAISGDFDRYTSIVLGILKQAGEIASETEDEDLIDYINALRAAILEAYTGILQGLKDAEKQDSVIPALDGMIALLQRCSEDDNKNDDVLKASVGLIGDLAQIFTNRVPILITMFMGQFVAKLFEEGKEAGDDIEETARWAERAAKAATMKVSR